MSKKADRQSGIALILVLWLLLLMSVMALGFSSSLRTDTLLSAYTLHASQARALAEAGISRALAELLTSPTKRKWKLDQKMHSFQFRGHQIQVQVQRESGRIDLNAGHRDLIKGLLQGIEMEPNKWRQLLDAILDWQDRDKLARNHGAEDREYQNAGLDYGAKDGPFNTVTELLQVRGMNSAIYRQLRGHLTVYSLEEGIDPFSASREVLLALPEISAAQVDNYLQERAKKGRQAILQGEVDYQYLSGNESAQFRIRSEVEVAGLQGAIEAVIRIRGKDQSPSYQILSWDESPRRDQAAAELSRVEVRISAER